MAYDHPTSLTHSKLLNFSCPARYHKLHVEGLPDMGDPARRGATVHTANELYLAALVRCHEVSSPELADLALHEAIVLESTPAHLIPDCEFLWANHTERFELDLDAFLEAEQRRVVGNLSFKTDWTYARPDAIEIHDLKTHFQQLTPDAAKKDLQARMYAFLASKVWPGFATYSFTYHFIRLNAALTVSFQPSELDAIGRQLDAHQEAIRVAGDRNEWPAAPGQQCSYCSFACPAVDTAARVPVRLLSPTEAEETASDLVLLTSVVGQKKRLLENWCNLNGPVIAADHEWAHRLGEEVAYPARPVLDILENVAADTSKLTFGSTALRSYLKAKKWAGISEELAALAQKTPKTTFGAKKLGHVEDGPDVPVEA